MWKPSKNPKVEELTKSCKDRSYPISDLPWIIVDGEKRCYWCGDPLKTKHHAQRYCGDKNCAISAFAWGNPQKENGLWFLLQKQDWKCAVCQYDWKQFVKDNVIGKSYGTHSKTDFIQFNEYLVIRLKQKIEEKYRPEVDHIIPISKGGESLGLSNHQILCYLCHKTKTKVDNAGPRKKN